MVRSFGWRGVVGVVDVEEDYAHEPHHQQPVVHEQPVVVILVACLLQKHEAMVHDDADQGHPRHDCHHHRTLQEVHAEESSDSIEEQPLAMVVEPLCLVVFTLDEPERLE